MGPKPTTYDPPATGTESETGKHPPLERDRQHRPAEHSNLPNVRTDDRWKHMHLPPHSLKKSMARLLPLKSILRGLNTEERVDSSS